MRLLALFLLLAGCAADPTDQWSGTIETLADGRLRVTSPAEGVWRDDTAWRLVPELVLGEVDGPQHLTFAAVIGLEVDDEGRIYVLDRQANELRIFAADGAHVSTTGRSGRGPGEYNNANGLLWLTPDTLLVVDQSGRRYSLLNKEGEFVRSVPRSLGFYGWAFSGGYANGRIYETSYVYADPDNPRPVLLSTSLKDAPAGSVDGSSGVSPDAMPPVLAGVDTLLLPVSGGSLVSNYFGVRTDQGSMSMSVPFAPESVYHLTPEGALWHGHGSEFRIIRSTLQGDTAAELVVADAVPTSVLDSELEEWAATEIVARFRAMGGDLDMGRIAKQKPFFDGMYVDPEGYLWVSIPSAPAQATFGIFDPEGWYLGSLNATGVERETYIPPVVRNDRLYFVGTDDLGVQRIFVFRIER